MRRGTLALAMTMTVTVAAGGARAAPECPAGDDVRSQAECVHDQMAAKVIDKLYALALSTVTVKGKLAPDDVPADFLYVAEEAGEAARRKGPKALVEMARSNDAGKLAFAARAITAYLDSVRHGYSHRDRFGNEGDAKLYADAKRILGTPCKRFAAHGSRFLREEGKRCLSEIDPRPPLPSSLFDAPPDMSHVRAVPLSAGGGLRGSKEGAMDAAPRPAKPARKTAP